MIRKFREHKLMRRKFGLAAILLIASVTAGPAWADSTFFSTGDPDDNMAILAGSTVPEPSSIYLLSVGSLSLLLGSIFVRRIPTRA